MSSGGGGNEMMMMHHDPRRFSMDSVAAMRANASTQAAAAAAAAAAGGFNRFNAISEADFEEPNVNQKYLMLDHQAHTQQHRLSTLQTRNLQAKPHLKSSYALEAESVPAAVTEDQIRGKENAEAAKQQQQQQQQQTAGSMLKRRHVDEAGEMTLKSPKKSSYLKQTNI